MEKRNVWQKALGAVLILVGLLALVTPLTPGSWLVFVGAELMGIRFLFLERIKAIVQKKKPDSPNTPKDGAVQ